MASVQNPTLLINSYLYKTLETYTAGCDKSTKLETMHQSINYNIAAAFEYTADTCARLWHYD